MKSSKENAGGMRTSRILTMQRLKTHACINKLRRNQSHCQTQDSETTRLTIYDVADNVANWDKPHTSGEAGGLSLNMLAIFVQELGHQ